MNWLKFRTNLDKAVKFILPMVDSAIEFKKQPGVLSGIKLAAHTRTAYEKVYLKGGRNFTNDPEWENIHSIAIEKYLFNLLKKEGEVRPIGDKMYWIKCFDAKHQEEYTYGYHNRDHAWIYVKKGDVAGWNHLREIFWKSVDGVGLIDISKNEEIQIFPYEKKATYTTEVTEKYTEEIKKFKEHGYSRSILLYGRPGTGKSNAGANILSKLGYRTIIFNNLNNVSNTFVRSNIEQLGAEAIVVEDLDHMVSEEANKMLDSLQHLSDKGLLLIGTCNRIKSLDLSLIRRFNEAVEVNTLPVEVIREVVGTDDELFGMVGNFTIHLLMELKRRLEVLGREETLQRMKDLIETCELGNTDEYRL